MFDCIFDVAQACVVAYCHSEEGSRVDTESKRVYKVKNPNTGKVESHPARVWNEVTLEQQHNAFLKSSIYKKFKEMYGAIGQDRFRTFVCPCV
jgi:hypothetical protein